MEEIIINTIKSRLCDLLAIEQLFDYDRGQIDAYEDILKVIKDLKNSN